jgi:hypothetical protein
VLVVLLLIAYVLVRKAFLRLSERISIEIDQRLVSALARGKSKPGGPQEEARDQLVSARALAQIERLARLMDSAISLPVVGGIGLDALLGLFPVAGDVISAGVSLHLIRRSLEFGLPRSLITKMIANSLTDVLLGLIPVVGDIADVAYRGNSRNVALLKEYLRQRGSRAA